ncbi:hypothetical protein [Pseudomonas soli]|uniref:hypothetical protein n=1 Tax=Pseudomonas soli TaxID=1306993 RepID=UPI0021ABCB0E|nr:hypothetical protein [Pseudomonas soli]
MGGRVLDVAISDVLLGFALALNMLLGLRRGIDVDVDQTGGLRCISDVSAAKPKGLLAVLGLVVFTMTGQVVIDDLSAIDTQESLDRCRVMLRYKVSFETVIVVTNGF